jgi:hypothetical protein
LQAAFGQLGEVGCLLRGQPAPVGLGAQHRGHGVADRLGLEQLLADQHLVEDHAEGPDVGAAIDLLAARLLGRHVGGGSEDRARLGHGRRDRGRHGRVRVLVDVAEPRARQSEVEDLHVADRRDHDVRRLEIAMDQTGLVRRFEPRGDLGGDRPCFLRRDRSVAQALGEVLALDEFHHQEADPVRLLEAVDRGHVRVLEAGERTRLAFEAGLAFRIVRHLRRQDLEGDLAFELGVAGAVDLAHAATAHLGGDLVMGQFSSDQWAWSPGPRRGATSSIADRGPGVTRTVAPAP